MVPICPKYLPVKNPGAIIDNSAVTCNVIDCKGADFLRVGVMLGATDIALTVLKLTESDVASSGTALTNPNDVPGSVFGTDPNDTGSTSTLPSATDDNKIYIFEVDLRGRKRYVLPAITIGDGSTGAYVVAWAELHRNEIEPRTAAQIGAGQLMRIPSLAA